MSISQMKKGYALQIMKIIGVSIFIWILSQIDRAELLTTLSSAKLPLLALSLFPLAGIYICKALRWHFLVRAAGGTQSLKESWRMFHIGNFLSTITPAKLGEFGRAAYLKKHGFATSTALALNVIDRFADVCVIGLFAIGALYLLFGLFASLIAAIGTVMGVLGFLATWKLTQSLRTKFAWLQFLEKIIDPRAILSLVSLTILSWTLYFLWVLLAAASIGIVINPFLMIAVLTLTGIVALLPIAPSGLGTRDAALITLLSPLGVEPANAVAIGFLMFLGILIGSIPGAIYWFTEKKDLD